jgi:LuxR family transcriptional regulator, maltose regulon positive regulatory protein
VPAVAPGPVPAAEAAAGAAARHGPPTLPRTLPPALTAVPLIEAKLAPPLLRRGLVTRDALLGRLGAADERLVAVIAGPGYGKTTVLAQWRARERRPVAWLTVDPADDDPVRFLTYVAVAIDRAVGLDPAVFELLATAGLSSQSTTVARLVAALHQSDPRLVLMLDDIHRLERTPTVDALAMLIEYVPAGVQVALAGRTDAGLPLARLRGRTGVLDVTDTDLALDVEEAAETIRRHDRDLPPEQVRQLVARTEGWPVALYLAVRAQGPLEPGAGGPWVAANSRAIGAYLDAELLGRMAPATRVFLMQTAILERLTGSLADAVTGRTGTGALLARLAATHDLVVPLDMEGGWYRYHMLLREHLVALLERESSDVATLRRRAAEWLAANGLVESAVDHLLAAGDRDAAAAHISSIALRSYRSGRAETLNRWLVSLDDATLRRHPYVATVGAWIHLLAGRPDMADRMATLMEAGEYDGRRPEGAESFEAARALVRACLGRSGLEAAIADAGQAVALEPTWSPWRPTCLSVYGSALAVGGDREAADEVLRQTVSVAPGMGAFTALVAAAAGRALLAIERDDWLAADGLVREGLESASRARYNHDMTAALIAAVAARVAVRRNRLAEARRHLADFQVARATLTQAVSWFAVRYLLEAARAYLALADPAGARTVLQQAEDIVRLRPDLGHLPEEVATLRARMRNLPLGAAGASTLTTAEIRVLRLLPTYLSVPEIAERLCVAPSTVRTQVQSIYGKLGATSRAESVERAIEAGLLEPLPVLSAGDITSP